MRKYVLLSIGLTVLVAIFFSACSEESIKYQRYYSDGLNLYKTHCGNCHMEDGSGLGKLIPPLTDTIYLKENRDKLACIIVYGLSDSIVINGIGYKEKMPAEKHLAAVDLAKLLTYVTNAFGNNQGLYDISEVEKNLRNCK
ncbi:copper oxidase [Pelobium manganitolerans]|uniref:Copper oxidase n=1 Tax=Pelobium manganitolerans TaxID=1842495 RepID=A0A419S3R8_9SPHI|nr:cytochrome c [Pelobium manganitolerans]RKD13820.1 copper oxidase [Pelobium manganitolerans]